MGQRSAEAVGRDGEVAGAAGGSGDGQAGEKVAAAPVGSPGALRVTAPLKALMGLTATVKVVEPPTITVAGAEVGVRVMVKSGVRMVVESVAELGVEPPPETLTWLVSTRCRLRRWRVGRYAGG
jgi:hypothetical protein